MTWKKLAFLDEVATLSDTAPEDADHAAAAAGSASEAARRDHKHDLTEGNVGTLAAVDGAGASLGTDNAVPHLDHVHALGPLVADLDFNEREAVDLVIYKISDYASLTDTEGKLIYYPGDDHLYCYVV